MNKFAGLLLFLSLGVAWSAEEKAKSPAADKKDDQWLQKYIQEQQKLQENQKSDSKENPFKAIEKPREEKPKSSSEPFNLLSSKEKQESKSSSKIEAPKPVSNNIDTSFKPSISGMSTDAFYQQRRESQNRALAQQMDSSIKDGDEFEKKNEDDSLDKMRREKLKQDLNDKSKDDLFNRNMNMSISIDHPSLAEDKKNPYVNQNRSLFDRDKEDPESIKKIQSIQSIQSIKPIEVAPVTPNPYLNNPGFENPYQTRQNQNKNSMYDQMMINPGTGKNRIQDPNDFLKR